MVSKLEQGEPWIPDLGSKEKELPRGRHTGDRQLHADLLPSSRERKSRVEQDHWGFEDEKVAGVHWGYEETKTYLAILSETQFYEALRNCHRNSQLYGAVAERLWEHGFLRTPEQCRTKFKSLQTSYRKVKNGQAPETCPFFEEMDALVSAGVAAQPSDGQEEEAGSCPIQTSEAEAEKQAEEADEAIEDSEDDDEDTEVPPEAVTRAPVLFQSPSGKTLLLLKVEIAKGRHWDLGEKSLD